MILSLQIAATGMNAQQTSIDVIANNIANTSTNGFKKGRAIFQDLLYQNIRQAGAQSSQQTQLSNGLLLGVGVNPVSVGKVFTQGGIQQTGNGFDVAINGNGFFQIQLPDGSIGYTRDGAFQMDNQGQLVTASGYVVMPGITIPSNALSVTIAKDGTVSVTQPGTPAQTTSQLGNLLLAVFVNPGGLQSVGENLFVETASSGTANASTPGLNGAGTLSQNMVESSNVNVAEELVNMIQTQRSYEMNAKVISSSDAMLGKLTQL